MYRTVFIQLLLIATIFHAEAQRPTPDQIEDRLKTMGEHVQVERIAYFSEKIGLTSEEAQRFWPIYNEMDNRRNDLFKERASILHEFVNDAEKLTDRLVDERLNRLVAIQQEEMALPTEYFVKFREILPARKVMNLHVAEMGFRNYLLQRMRLRRPGNSPEKQ